MKKNSIIKKKKAKVYSKLKKVAAKAYQRHEEKNGKKKENLGGYVELSRNWAPCQASGSRRRKE